jgi:hypothetical protein
MSHLLLKAAEKNDIKKLEELLAQGADANYADKAGPGRTALSVASLSGHREAVEFLIKRGANINYQDRAMGYTPLTWAANQGHVEVARSLIKAGADLNLVSRPAKTSALIAAAAEGKAEMVELLIESGADVDAVTDANENALTVAEKRRQPRIIEILKRHGLTAPPAQRKKEINLQDLPLEIVSAKAALYEFVKAWSEWEKAMSRKVDPFNDEILKAQHAEILAKYCTPRNRAYVDGVLHFSPQLTYPEMKDSNLIGTELVKPTRVHLDFKSQWEFRRFVMMRKRTGWFLDGIKWKATESDKWHNGLIGG